MLDFIRNAIRRILIALLCAFVLALMLFIVLPHPDTPAKFTYGITFSKDITQKLGLDWKSVYLSILDDLGITVIRLSAYWEEVEPSEGVFSFDELDWQIAEAKKRNIGVMLAVGQKLPRWPECHYPSWLRSGDEAARRALTETEQTKLLSYIARVTERYAAEPAVIHWQVENEPFLPFGICPVLDPVLLDKEIAVIKTLGGGRPLVISESGEFSTWLGAARRADVIGSTLYRVVWWQSIGYFRYPIPAWFYWKKVSFIKMLYDVQDIIVIELQGEPWAHKQIYENPVSEMMKSMDHDQFVENLRYARDARFATQYVWGAEWWYWMKEKQNDPFYWDTARKVFRGEYDFGE